LDKGCISEQGKDKMRDRETMEVEEIAFGLAM
jgi:hypothetical protein